MVTLNKRSVFRFIRYSIIGITTFAFDLFLLFLLIDHFHIHYLPATALAFLVAISLNFLMSRYTVFHKTERPVVHSYLYFVSFAILSVILITGLMHLLVSVFELHYAPSRVVIAGCVGVLNYIMNLKVTFDVEGKH
ncbi:MAG TPA: GtrA family protein [Candidatus Paceibacterota bacterium]|nr:GtrA family protein [Candidatus Paceibacterota bacterium]